MVSTTGWSSTIVASGAKRELEIREAGLPTLDSFLLTVRFLLGLVKWDETGTENPFWA